MLTISAFARRAGVSRQAIHSAVKRCKIPSIDGKIDENDPVCAEYLSGRNPSVPRQVATSYPQSNGSPDDLTQRARIDAEKAKQQTIHWQIRNAKDRGELIDRLLVAKAIRITDSEHQRLLSDTAETIAKLSFDLVKSGDTVDGLTGAIRSELSGVLKAWKRQIASTLKMFYDE